MSRDLHNNIDVKRGISPAAAVTDDTALVSEIFDMADYESAEFVILTGSLADVDATFTVLAEEGADSGLADNAAIDDTNLLGTEALASFTFAADDKVFKLGLRPNAKRYKRVTVTPVGNTGNVFIAGIWIGQPKVRPAANPPA